MNARKFTRNLKRIALGAGSIVALGASNASAEIVWTGVTLNTADVSGYMAIAVVGLATLWGFRKVVKTMNRS